MAENLPVDLQIEGLQNAVEIGVGGFATVYRADQPAFRRTVAVKVLATRNLDEAARERFERECQAMGSLSEHPNIVTVYGAGFAASGSPYLVMTYLPGGSLQERLDRQGSVPWQDASLYGVHLAGALETAHRVGIVHRDIKPGNILMSSYGDAQLTDFGIARISGGHETRSGVITASMSHAPPEVLDGARPTVAADIYSLGSTIYELLAGQAAFASDSDESMVPMLRRILTEPPPDLRYRGVPDAVCRVIERSLAKDPAQRQQSALQLGRELQQARTSLGLDPGRLTVPAGIDAEPQASIDFVTAPVPAGAPVTTGPPGLPGANRPVTPGPASGRSSVLPTAVIGAAVVLLAAVVAVLIVINSRSDGDVIATTPTTLTSTSISSETTDVNGPSTTEGTYTATIENNFVDRCAENPGNGRTFCRCVFSGIKEQVKYSDFVDIERSLDEGTDINETPIAAIIIDCQRKHPGSPGGTTP
jgi:serine/threonine protein kinase